MGKILPLESCLNYILSLFYVPESLILCLETCLESISDGSVGGELLKEMFGGERCGHDQSPLAIFESEDTFAGRYGWDKVLNQALRRDVKSMTKALLRTIKQKVVQNTTPPPRFLKRQESRESGR
jgi:hypothetical protein